MMLDAVHVVETTAASAHHDFRIRGSARAAGVVCERRKRVVVTPLEHPHGTNRLGHRDRPYRRGHRCVSPEGLVQMNAAQLVTYITWLHLQRLMLPDFKEQWTRHLIDGLADECGTPRHLVNGRLEVTAETWAKVRAEIPVIDLVDAGMVAMLPVVIIQTTDHENGSK